MKKFLSFVKGTPFHPQWHSFRDEKKLLSSCKKHAKGLVVDIGCANMQLKALLPSNCSYYGLDYLDTSVDLYKTYPNIFGDAQKLPFLDQSIDTITLLEVLEHIPDPSKAISEIYRVLKKEGTLILSAPFLYPLHDVPYDFHRWTCFAIENLALQHNFSIVELNFRGQPFETAALLSNIAASKTALNLIASYNPVGILLLLLLPIFIPFTNIAGAFFALFDYKDNFMPFGYRAVFKKH